jgi:HEAT repeat protein
MSERPSSQSDPRSVDDLINVALTETDEWIAWDAVGALHSKGTVDAFQRAQSLCRSPCPQERRLGADILGQLGIPERTFPRGSAAILILMLELEEDAGVLRSIFSAFGHLHEPAVIGVVPRFVNHPDRGVRFAVVMALAGHECEAAVDLMIRLTSDADSDVRDWATFGLGTQLKLDTPRIRNALVARLDDPDEDTRGEAMIGLACRNDQRAIPAILKDLETGFTDKPLDAAAYSQSPELLGAVIALRGSPRIATDVLEEIIAACKQH